jgi:hypothetical protein
MRVGGGGRATDPDSPCPPTTTTLPSIESVLPPRLAEQPAGLEAPPTCVTQTKELKPSWLLPWLSCLKAVIQKAGPNLVLCGRGQGELLEVSALQAGHKLGPWPPVLQSDTLRIVRCGRLPLAMRQHSMCFLGPQQVEGL